MAPTLQFLLAVVKPRRGRSHVALFLESNDVVRLAEALEQATFWSRPAVGSIEALPPFVGSKRALRCVRKQRSDELHRAREEHPFQWQPVWFAMKCAGVAESQLCWEFESYVRNGPDCRGQAKLKLAGGTARAVVHGESGVGSITFAEVVTRVRVAAVIGGRLTLRKGAVRRAFAVEGCRVASFLEPYQILYAADAIAFDPGLRASAGELRMSPAWARLVLQMLGPQADSLLLSPALPWAFEGLHPANPSTPRLRGKVAGVVVKAKFRVEALLALRGAPAVLQNVRLLSRVAAARRQQEWGAENKTAALVWLRAKIAHTRWVQNVLSTCSGTLGPMLDQITVACLVRALGSSGKDVADLYGADFMFMDIMCRSRSEAVRRGFSALAEPGTMSTAILASGLETQVKELVETARRRPSAKSAVAREIVSLLVDGVSKRRAKFEEAMTSWDGDMQWPEAAEAIDAYVGKQHGVLVDDVVGRIFAAHAAEEVVEDFGGYAFFFQRQDVPNFIAVVELEVNKGIAWMESIERVVPVFEAELLNREEQQVAHNRHWADYEYGS